MIDKGRGGKEEGRGGGEGGEADGYQDKISKQATILLQETKLGGKRAEGRRGERGREREREREREPRIQCFPGRVQAHAQVSHISAEMAKSITLVG